MNFVKKIIPLVLILISVSCSKKMKKNNSNEVTTKLDSLFSSQFSENEPGCSILLKKNDDIVFLKNIGVENLKTGKKITENTVFNTGSISKTFVSNAILIMKEKGLLSLEDSIYKYFKDFKQKEIAQQVKIKHLLSHTSGLPDLRNVRDNIEFYITAKDTANFAPTKQADSLNFNSGEKFQYSNPSYNGLALIIEKLAKQKWQQFIKENIFTPSGMKTSKITDGPHPKTDVAHGYFKNKENTYIEFDYGEVPTFAAAGNGGIWCSVLDLAKYEDALKKNLFLSKDLIKESRTVYYPKNWADTIKPTIGYSWFTGERSLIRNKNENIFDVNFVYHTGSQGGFKAFYITVPKKNILYVGLFNKHVTNLSEIMKKSLLILKESNWLDKD